MFWRISFRIYRKISDFLDALVKMISSRPILIVWNFLIASKLHLYSHRRDFQRNCCLCPLRYLNYDIWTLFTSFRFKFIGRHFNWTKIQLNIHWHCSITLSHFSLVFQVMPFFDFFSDILIRNFAGRYPNCSC